MCPLALNHHVELFTCSPVPLPVLSICPVLQSPSMTTSESKQLSLMYSVQCSSPEWPRMAQNGSLSSSPRHDALHSDGRDGLTVPPKRPTCNNKRGDAPSRVAKGQPMVSPTGNMFVKCTYEGSFLAISISCKAGSGCLSLNASWATAAPSSLPL